jgi:hypothetical protein
LEAIHLLDIALATDRSHADALTVKKEALQMLQRDSGGTNLSEVMWLKSELAAVEAAVAAAASR